jgi:hypothetical protein
VVAHHHTGDSSFIHGAKVRRCKIEIEEAHFYQENECSRVVMVHDNNLEKGMILRSDFEFNALLRGYQWLSDGSRVLQGGILLLCLALYSLKSVLSPVA